MFAIFCEQQRYERSAILATAQRKLCDVGTSAMMPVVTLRPVGISHVFPIPTRSRSSFCVTSQFFSLILTIFQAGFLL
jgi:hypothetical protein